MAETKAKDAHVWAQAALDWYVEPGRCTTQLLAVERFLGPIYDPCCGGGNIVMALRAGGYQAFGSDKVDRGLNPDWFLGERDFLEADAPHQNIVFNPPFFRAKGAEAFIRHGLALVTGKLCAFVDRRFLTGAGRAKGLYREHPPTRVWEITPRPSCPPGEWLAQEGNEAAGGTADYCWLVWDRTAPQGGTALGWLTDEAAPVRDD